MRSHAVRASVGSRTQMRGVGVTTYEFNVALEDGHLAHLVEQAFRYATGRSTGMSRAERVVFGQRLGTLLLEASAEWQSQSEGGEQENSD